MNVIFLHGSYEEYQPNSNARQISSTGLPLERVL